MTEDVAELADRLTEAAARLRSGGLSDDETAALVDECARLATRAGTALSALARGGDDEGDAGREPAPGQLGLDDGP